EVDLTPLQRQNLALEAPAGDVSERRGRLRVGGQVAAHRLELRTLEEAAARVVLLQHFDVGHSLQSLALHGEREHPLERRELAIDRGRRRLSLEPLCTVLRDVSAGELDRPASPEEGQEMREAEGETIG